MDYWIRKFVAVIVLIILIYTLWFGIQWRHFINTPMLDQHQSVDQTQFVDVWVKPGTTTMGLSYQLKRQGVINKPHFFTLLAKIKGGAHRLQAGEYRVTPGMKPFDFLNKVISGKVHYRSITLVDGLTFKEFLAKLNSNEYVRHDTSAMTEAQIATQLGISKQKLEGLFFPNTYLFERNTSDLTILKWSYQMMQKISQNLWRSREQGLPYKSLYQALIAASLIEKETAVPAEKVKVAGVIVRRLRKRMRLQIDPTVIYGLGDRYKGKLTYKDLKTNTPYNTYTNYGLPPTPISMPNKDSLYAALHPDDNDTLYFVATGKGGHFFSATLEEHNKAVNKYQLHLNAKRKLKKESHSPKNKPVLKKQQLSVDNENGKTHDPKKN